MMAGLADAHMFGASRRQAPMDFRTHSFLASHFHAASTNGGGDVLVGLAVVFGCSLVLFAVAWYMHGGGDDDSEPGGGGGGPRGPDRPPGGPSWWPDFERQFARYAAGYAEGRARSRDLVGAVASDRTVVPPET